MFTKRLQNDFYISSSNNQPRKTARQTDNSPEQMANPPLYHTQHKPLSGGAGKRVVTQESHPGSREAAQDGPYSAGKIDSSFISPANLQRPLY